jgi:hypothetical protein
MHTKDKLAAELRLAGLTEMADKAADGYYHDFLSPLALPEMQLLADLDEALTQHKGEHVLVHNIRNRHLAGEYDANKEESDAWAASEDGRRTFEAVITNDVRKQVGRLAMRQEGSEWVAYWAKPDTMDGAIKLGSIALLVVKNDQRRTDAFMDIFRSYIVDVFKETTGITPSNFVTQPAPEHEQ